MFAPRPAVASGAGATEPIASLVVHADAIILTRDAAYGRVFIFHPPLLLLKHRQFDSINIISVPMCHTPGAGKYLFDNEKSILILKYQ